MVLHDWLDGIHEQLPLDWGNRVTRLPDVWYDPSSFFLIKYPCFFVSTSLTYGIKRGVYEVRPFQ